jgi:phospholipid transport system transporter-binding protein
MAAPADNNAPAASGGVAMRREGDALVFNGALLRSAIATLWPRAGKAIAGVRRFDVRAVGRIDSAGLAFLSELAARGDGTIAIDGTPAGLAELSAAYRLSPSLAFAN